MKLRSQSSGQKRRRGMHPTNARSLVSNIVRLCGFAPSTLLLLLWSMAAPLSLRATLSEPDNVIYGIVVIDQALVTAADDNVVIEAQRSNGDVVASYRMGDNPTAGDNYVLVIPVESVGDPINLEASVFGSNLTILVRDNGMVKYQTDYVVGGRGNVQELDFGSLTPQSPYTIWEEFIGLPPGSGMLDSDEDGETNKDEYTAGTDPLDRSDKFALSIQLQTSGEQTEVSWFGRDATGLGYEGQTRFYALERVVDFDNDQWEEVAGFERIEGANTMIIHSDSTANSPTFYRARVWLE